MADAFEGTARWVADYSRLEREEAAREPSWLRDLRRRAIERFAERGFPTTRDEKWRHTNLGPLAKTAYPPAPPGRDGATSEKVGPFTLGDRAGVRLAFVNGSFSPDLSLLRPLPGGAVAESLAAVLARDPARVEPHVAAETAEHPFVALNAAFFRDGAFVHVPEGAVLPAPIHLLYLSTSPDGPVASHLRNLIVAGAGSRATILEHYVGLGDGGFTNAVTDVVSGTGAAVDHEKLQEEGDATVHFGMLRARPGRDASFASHVITLGGGLVRNEVDALLDEEGIDLTLHGLYLVDGRRHVDNQTRIDHAKRSGTSRELYKGVIDGSGRGVFEGTIVVRPDAQKTVARQTNRNLLLSPDALATTRPVLEISADDVKCNHGATIGQIDEDLAFYLRSRGLAEAEARALLVYAFARELLDSVRVEPVRERLERLLLRRFAGAASPAAVR